MLPCQGVATATANAQIFGFLASNRYGYPARSSVRARTSFLNLPGPALRQDKTPPPPLRAGAVFSSNAVHSSFTKYDPLKGINSIKPLPSISK